MIRPNKKVFVAVMLLTFAGFMVWAIYITFIAGTTGGFNFVRAIQSSNVSPDSISSIEIVEPTVGHMPFTAKEYESLPRRTKINAPASISRLLALLKNCQPGNVYQNHPDKTYSAYLKVNCQDGFYWLYCDVYSDGHSVVLYVDSNTRNAVNPNGASIYHLEDFSEVLAILQNKNAEPDGVKNENRK
jgi:hypothetical protein